MASELVPDARVVVPGVPYHTFITSIWTTTGLAMVFLFLRLYSRWLGKRRLHLDDYFIIFAGALALATAALWQWAAPAMYRSLTAAGLHGDLPADFPQQLKRFLVTWGVIQMFYATSLTAVKVSFLVFFRRLGGHMSRLRFIWWPVLFFTLASWAIMTGLVHYRCVFTSLEEIFEYCSTPDSIQFTTATLKVGCSLDVISDFLILLIPIILLWGVQIPRKRKIVFIGLISLTLVTIIISIARAADGFATHWNTHQDDVSYLCLWTAVEPCAAIIVACLTAFPQLFAPASSRRPVYTPGEVAWVEHHAAGPGGNRTGAGGSAGRINVLVSYGHHISRISQEPPMELEGDDKSSGDDLGYMHSHGARSINDHHQLSNLSTHSKSQESQLAIIGWEPPIPTPTKTAAAVAGFYIKTRTSVNSKTLS
ncbi:hypothetical protein QBC37DRAFT_432811 [Rhypophila decipiens]|uniref:Rhodopsin domain-containing protein n=1 Tax=Rhypophila decipiens TaxID=261697 RepID=A0AAN6XVU1_9PEZI|nr:hypothetical protein QBC37DRAFT_432811 [Rhypophila decipiens]